MTGSGHSWKGVGHSWQGGLAPACPARRSRFGFQKGLSDWGAHNLDRFRRLLEGGRPLLAGGVWLQTVRLGEARLPDSLKAPTGGGDMRRGGGFSSPLSPSVEFCRTRGPVEPRPLSTGERANDTSGFPGGPRQRGPCLAGGGRFCTKRFC